MAPISGSVAPAMNAPIYSSAMDDFSFPAASAIKPICVSAPQASASELYNKTQANAVIIAEKLSGDLFFIYISSVFNRKSVKNIEKSASAKVSIQLY